LNTFYYQLTHTTLKNVELASIPRDLMQPA